MLSNISPHIHSNFVIDLNTFKPPRTLQNIFFYFSVMAVDKKMAKKASRQQYIGMAAIIKEQKKKEKQETEDILKNMERWYAENEQKLEELGVKQKKDRAKTEKSGDSYVRMSVQYESEGISKALWEKLGEKLDKMDRDKKDYIISYKE